MLGQGLGLTAGAGGFFLRTEPQRELPPHLATSKKWFQEVTWKVKKDFRLSRVVAGLCAQ